MTSREDRIPEDEARAIWLRAARLQAEAEQRAEERAGRIPIGPGGDDPEEEGGLRPDVRAAAEEVGISAEFVQNRARGGGDLRPACPRDDPSGRARLEGVP